MKKRPQRRYARTWYTAPNHRVASHVPLQSNRTEGSAGAQRPSIGATLSESHLAAKANNRDAWSLLFSRSEWTLGPFAEVGRKSVQRSCSQVLNPTDSSKASDRQFEGVSTCRNAAHDCA